MEISVNGWQTQYSPIWGSFIVSFKKEKWKHELSIHISSDQLIGPEGRVFTNGPGHKGSIPGRVIPKIFKIVFDTSLLNIQQYKVRIKGKMEQSWERIAPSPTPRCSSNWKGSVLVALDYSHQLYLFFDQFLWHIHDEHNSRRTYNL